MPLAYGPFHRLASRTQSAADVQKQLDSGELWGAVPRWGSVPAVQAYAGPLPDGERGIEFTTEHPPTHQNWMNQQVAWNRGDPGVSDKKHDVEANKDYVGIKIEITKITQITAATPKKADDR